MGTNRITVNGQHYDGPEDMPPDVRRVYEEAMRAVAPQLGQASETVFSARSGLVNTNIVIRKNVFVKNQKYNSLDEMPPEVRQLAENALRQGGATGGDPSTRKGLHFSMNVGVSQPSSPAGPDATQAYRPLPIEPTSASSSRIKAQHVLWGLIFWVAVALVLWAFLGR